MSEIDAKVLSAVEAALERNPKASVDELFAIARDVNGAVADLTKRQFHARYPLQVKRRLAPSKPRAVRGKTKKPPRARGGARQTTLRDAVRDCFLRFASDLASAEARKDLVKVVAGVDRYVDEVLEATGRR